MFLYSTFEIIFWYSAFVVTVIGFIFYLVFHNKRQKQLVHIQQSISKEITRLEGIRKNFDKKKHKEIFNKTLLMLQSLENSLYVLKDKSPIPDIDVELTLIDNLQAKLKVIPKGEAEIEIYLAEVISQVSVINSTFVTIMGVIK